MTSYIGKHYRTDKSAFDYAQMIHIFYPKFKERKALK